MLTIEEIERGRWDCLVVGTGIGGATLGSVLANAGWQVLFVEKGRAAFRHDDALRGTYPESSMRSAEAASLAHASLLARAGRCHEEIQDGRHSFVPYIGCGSGGSSALYGMAMERFFPADFEPRRNFPDQRGSSLPDAWPVGYNDMTSYYQRAEALYRVRGGRDPTSAFDSHALDTRSLSPSNAELCSHFQRLGLHPYRLPLACECIPGCECCQGYLCAHGCKNDSSRICLEPAVRRDGATLLDECEVTRLEAGPDRVTAVIGRWQGRSVTLKADHVVLAAGALMTPALLLRSASTDWPQGMANSSGQVGKNLMRHCIDLYLVFPRNRRDSGFKQFGLNDFYQSAEGKLGTVQSFGRLPPPAVLAADMIKDVQSVRPWASPLLKFAQPALRGMLSRPLRRGVLLAGIMEDLPYAANRITPGPPLGIHYELHLYELARLRAFRKRVAKALRPYRFLRIRQAEKNVMLAHACGTCRFGEDPSLSVLDPYNKAHGMRNLHVVDSSFFPSSGGTNPALTIAANALRVADHLLSERGSAPRSG
ncbi:MAG TPA: GMC family oxidoreductase [Acidobacteriaceae bacterium]|nr:GMC family oxidoreductase [Acidobacteriaceae bacterium]